MVTKYEKLRQLLLDITNGKEFKSLPRGIVDEARLIKFVKSLSINDFKCVAFLQFIHYSGYEDSPTEVDIVIRETKDATIN